MRRLPPLDRAGRRARTALCRALAAAFAVAFAVAPIAALAESPVATAPGGAGAPRARIVSLNPSLSEIVLALGARDVLVGVDTYTHRQHPELDDVPDVGGLFDPSLEAVVALRPDAVVLVPSAEQRDFRGRLEALGVRVVVFANLRFDEVLANITRLGDLVGEPAQARARVARIRATRAAVRGVTASRAPVRCLVALQREPVFVVGAGNFIDEMLASAGCENVGRALGEGYPRASLEWVVAQAPDVVFDTSEHAAGAGSEAERAEIARFWQRWSAIPAVRTERVLQVDARTLTLPGPALDVALRQLALALHGAEVDAAIAATLDGDLAPSVEPGR